MVINPSDHQLRAALEVARIVDAEGDPAGDVRDAYRHLITHGEHTQHSLREGERLLLSLGLLIEVDGRLCPSDALRVLANVGVDTGEKALRTWVKGQFDQDQLNRIGAAGEAVVMAACRQELLDLGQSRLASEVQQVSLIDDTLGYDIDAPSVGGLARHLEVKTTTQARVGLFDFYISRNEFEVGRREPNSWSIVACTWDLEAEARILGWCRASTVTPYLPVDANGRWTEARVSLPKVRLFRGIPPPI